MIEEKTKKIDLMKENLQIMKDKIYQIEESRKRIISYNDSIKKQNERLLLDKKKREDYILKKPIILGKINEYETKSKNFEDINRNNEIENMNKENQKIAQQIRDSEKSKPLNYENLIYIQKNPNENINQKILLLESLIKESKDRQNEFIEIFAYYDDYVKQKENYELINNEAKMIEEKNSFNMNINNTNDNMEFSLPKKSSDDKVENIDEDDDKIINKEFDDNSRAFIPSSNDSKPKFNESKKYINDNNNENMELNKNKSLDNKNKIEEEEGTINKNVEKNETEEFKIINNDNNENLGINDYDKVNDFNETNEKKKKDDYIEKYDYKDKVNNDVEEDEKLNEGEEDTLKNKKAEKLNESKEIFEIEENKKYNENDINKESYKNELIKNSKENNANIKSSKNEDFDESKKFNDFKNTSESKEFSGPQELLNENKEKKEIKESLNKEEENYKNEDINENREDINEDETKNVNNKIINDNKEKNDNEIKSDMTNNNNTSEKDKTDKTDNKKKNEKKLNSFKLILSIMLSVKNISNDKVEDILLKYKNSKTDNIGNNSDEKKAFLLYISKDILNLVNDKNESDIKLLRKLLNYLLEEKYQNNKENFLNNLTYELIGKNKLAFGDNEDEENKLLGKIIQIYSVKSNVIIEKMKKDDKKLLSYKNLKKCLKEEKLYIKNNKEKTELFKFFIYVLKKNSSWYGDNISLFDFIVEDIINFFNGIQDIANDKKNDEDMNNINEADEGGLSITDEDFKKIINGFITDLNMFLIEKKMRIDELLGEDNINIMINEGKEIEVINIYKFIEIIREKGFKLNDNLIISCIFARYQINENLEDIDLSLLQNDLKQV